MHGMKGLEFQAVAVIGISDGTVPRARDHLYMSYSASPSPFLAQR